MVNDLRPDLIVLTGDFVSEPFRGGNRKKAALASEPCAELLRQMQAPQGSWAVLGNHDVLTDANRIVTSLQDQGIHVLVNQSVAIERDGARFWIGGIDDALERTPISTAPCTKFRRMRQSCSWRTSQTMPITRRAIQSICNCLDIRMEGRSGCLCFRLSSCLP